eukprot:scaffold232840_cov27-Tisochrysis_lutea.AAC.3
MAEKGAAAQLPQHGTVVVVSGRPAPRTRAVHSQVGDEARRTLGAGCQARIAVGADAAVPIVAPPIECAILRNRQRVEAASRDANHVDALEGLDTRGQKGEPRVAVASAPRQVPRIARPMSELAPLVVAPREQRTGLGDSAVVHVARCDDAHTLALESLHRLRQTVGAVASPAEQRIAARWRVAPGEDDAIISEREHVRVAGRNGTHANMLERIDALRLNIRRGGQAMA